MAKRDKRKLRQAYRQRQIDNRNRTLRNMVRKFDDPILYRICDAVDEDPSHTGDDLSFIDDMIAVLKAHDSGVGLAAPQIGVPLRVCLIKPKDSIKVMINPLIFTKSADTNIAVEGCLSYPKYSGPVERFSTIKVAYYDRQFKKHEEEITGFEARIVQHEVDHLDGICEVGKFWRQSVG